MTFIDRNYLVQSFIHEIQRSKVIGAGPTIEFSIFNPITSKPKCIELVASEFNDRFDASEVAWNDIKCSSCLLPGEVRVVSLNVSKETFTPISIDLQAIDLNRVFGVPQTKFIYDIMSRILSIQPEEFKSNLAFYRQCLREPVIKNPFFYNHEGIGLAPLYNTIVRYFWFRLHGNGVEMEDEMVWERESSIISIISAYKSLEPDQYDRMCRILITDTLKQELRYSMCMGANAIANSIFFMTCFDFVVTDNGKTSIIWQFMTEESAPVPGAAWKWYPISRMFSENPQMSLRLRSILIDINNHFKSVKQTEVTHQTWESPNKSDEALTARMIKTITSALDAAISKLSETIVKTTIFDTLMSHLRSDYFQHSMDNNPMLLGTLNGFIDLSCRPARFVSGHHRVPITKSVYAKYVPEDSGAHDKRMLQLKDMWRAQFHENNDPRDVVSVSDWTLMYLAHGLDGRIKAPFAISWVAAAKTGKTFWSELYCKTIGIKDSVGNSSISCFGYATKVNNLLLDDNQGETASSHTTSLMPLATARVGVMSEVPAGKKIGIMIKKYFSQESITGREVYGSERIFTIKANLWYISNFDPDFVTYDTGSIRRWRIYRPKYIYTSDPSPDNPFERKGDPKMNKVFRGEELTRNAWFSILLEAYERLQNEFEGDFERVPLPHVIIDETKVFLYDKDFLYRFCCDHLVISMGSKIDLITMGQKFREWYSVNNTQGKLNIASIFADIKISCLDRFVVNNNGFVELHNLRFANQAPMGDGERSFRDHTSIF
jgi:hypothetical protein